MCTSRGAEGGVSGSERGSGGDGGNGIIAGCREGDEWVEQEQLWQPGYDAVGHLEGGIQRQGVRDGRERVGGSQAISL